MRQSSRNRQESFAENLFRQSFGELAILANDVIRGALSMTLDSLESVIISAIYTGWSTVKAIFFSI